MANNIQNGNRLMAQLSIQTAGQRTYTASSLHMLQVFNHIRGEETHLVEKTAAINLESGFPSEKLSKNYVYRVVFTRKRIQLLK